jgi:hypothetical protein
MTAMFWMIVTGFLVTQLALLVVLLSALQVAARADQGAALAARASGEPDSHQTEPRQAA